MGHFSTLRAFGPGILKPLVTAMSASSAWWEIGQREFTIQEKYRDGQEGLASQIHYRVHRIPVVPALAA